jgi:hypothetical protein
VEDLSRPSGTVSHIDRENLRGHLLGRNRRHIRFQPAM